jgi:hypothetical protein
MLFAVGGDGPESACVEQMHERVGAHDERNLLGKVPLRTHADASCPKIMRKSVLCPLQVCLVSDCDV